MSDKTRNIFVANSHSINSSSLSVCQLTLSLSKSVTRCDIHIVQYSVVGFIPEI